MGLPIEVLPCPPPIRWRPGLVGRYPGQACFMELGSARVPIRFRWCPPSTDGTEAHSATGFWIAQHPVNQRQWEAVMGSNPSQFVGADHPVDSVSWDDASRFCKLAGLRLPTSKEWEYACRAGSTADYAVGEGEDLNSQLANFNGNHPGGGGRSAFEWWFREATLPQGTLPPNAWSLYEMHGQLWEWCDDWIDFGRSTNDWGRVLRGGCWIDFGRDAASGDRVGFRPGLRRGNVGFRPCPSSITSQRRGASEAGEE